LAEQLLREVLEFAPAEVETWHILAAILNRQGQLDEARQCLKRVIKLKETHISLQTDLPVSKRMAKLLWAQDEPDTALAMLAELLLTSPEDQTLIALQQTWTAS
jgi:Flp pilus assembly protein TadD